MIYRYSNTQRVRCLKCRRSYDKSSEEKGYEGECPDCVSKFKKKMMNAIRNTDQYSNLASGRVQSRMRKEITQEEKDAIQELFLKKYHILARCNKGRNVIFDKMVKKELGIYINRETLRKTVLIKELSEDRKKRLLIIREEYVSSS